MGMQVKTEPLPKSQVGLEISVGKEECKAAWESVIRELQKKAHVDGFRKGKVPKQIIVNRFGEDRLKASACEEVIEKSIHKALGDAGINAIGQAEFNSDGGVEEVISQYSTQNGLTFKVKVDVWPDIVFTDSYKELAVEAEEPEFDESLIDTALFELRKKESFSVLSPDGTTADFGKMVVVDMIGFFRKDDGSKGDRLPDIADGNSVEITLEGGKFMAGFAEGIVGMEVNETRSIPVEFPEANARPELAGVKAIFDITLQAVKDVVLPELDDDFVSKVSEVRTVTELREQIRGRLGVETENARQSNINKALEERLAEIVDVELPESLVESQVQNKFAKMLSGFKDNGMSDAQVKAMVTKENYELYKQRGRGTVEKQLKINFAVGKIAKENEMVQDPEEVDAQIALVRAELKGQEFEEEKIRDQVEAQLERDMVLKMLKEISQVTMVPPKKEEEAETAEKPAEAVAAQ